MKRNRKVAKIVECLLTDQPVSYSLICSSC